MYKLNSGLIDEARHLTTRCASGRTAHKLNGALQSYFNNAALADSDSHWRLDAEKSEQRLSEMVATERNFQRELATVGGARG